MITSYRRPALAACALAASAWVANAHAASTDVVLNLEGNPTCSSLGPNNAIMSIKISGPVDNGTDVSVSDGQGQDITYNINPDNAVAWTVDNGVAVNYVILKGKGGNGGGTVYHYGVGGSGGDSTLVLFPETPESDEGPEVTALSFCYGLSDELPEPPPPPPPIAIEDAGNCADLQGTMTLDQTAFLSCPPPGIDPSTGLPTDERIIVSFNPNEDNFALKFCTCNLGRGSGPGTFDKCDPNATQTENGEQGPDACPNGAGFVERVPISILGVEDPGSFLCFAAGGGRDCFFHFSK